MLDLLVIGAGLSGLCAALSAAEAGQSVRVIAKGMGALHWSAGTVDLLGYLPDSDQALRTPLEALGRLPPDHPYRHYEPSQILDALTWFQTIVGKMGLTYAGASEVGVNLLLPSPVGALRPAFLAPLGQFNGRLADGAPMVIVGLRGMRDFYPTLIAENLATQGYRARAEFVALDALISQQDRNTVQLAEMFEAPPVRRRLAHELRRLVQPGERIGLPAILGTDRHAEVIDEVADQSGAAIFEIPTLPPSVPGIRLFRALRRRLTELDVRIETGMEAIAFAAQERRIQWVETATSSRPLKHRAANFILASGGVLGGGFDSDADGRCWEVVFGLPLTVSQDRSQWFRARFLDREGQPVFSGGVATDHRLQPIDATGEAIYENLWVVGDALAGVDPLRERSLEGLAIVTGMMAARACAAHGQAHGATNRR